MLSLLKELFVFNEECVSWVTFSGVAIDSRGKKVSRGVGRDFKRSFAIS